MTPQCSSVCRALARPTLSADPNRTLIGDDEHGWGPQGVFNFEGGCYAKTIKLSKEAEPEIYDATLRFGAVLENVVFYPETRICDFDDDSKTENTRSAYPLEFISNASRTGRAGIPKNVVFLTADAYGVMPPIAKLTPAQAMYHSCRAIPPRLPAPKKASSALSRNSRPASVRRSCRVIPQFTATCCCETDQRSHGVDCWLVNTGWTGGIYGVGSRMPIKVTRALVTGALDGSLKKVEFHTDPYFGFAVPIAAACRASSRKLCFIRSRPGPTRRRSTRPPASSSPCSSRTSPNTKRPSIRKSARRRRKCGWRRRSNSSPELELRKRRLSAPPATVGENSLRSFPRTRESGIRA